MTTARSPSGSSFCIPKPSPALCRHLCPSLLTSHVSLQLSCRSLGTWAMVHISLEDLGHADCSLPNPFPAYQQEHCSLLGSRVSPDSSPTPYSYSSGSRLMPPCLTPAIRRWAHPAFQAAASRPPSPYRFSCSACWHPTLYVAEAGLGYYLPSVSQALGLQTCTTICRNTCFLGMISICRQPYWPGPFSKCLAYHTFP